MLRDSQPVAIVPTADADRSKAFYGDVLGLSFVDDDGFALVFQDELEIWTAPGGAPGGVVQGPGRQRAVGFSAAWLT